MKFIVFIFVLVAVLHGCKSPVSPAMYRAFIPGTYTRHSTHEFGEEYDTLSISLLNSAVNQYQITRRWKYERLHESASYQLSSSSGFLKNKVLEDTESGDLISFDEGEHCLFIGTIKYVKL